MSMSNSNSQDGATQPGRDNYHPEPPRNSAASFKVTAQPPPQQQQQQQQSSIYTQDQNLINGGEGPRYSKALATSHHWLAGPNGWGVKCKLCGLTVSHIQRNPRGYTESYCADLTGISAIDVLVCQAPEAGIPTYATDRYSAPWVLKYAPRKTPQPS